MIALSLLMLLFGGDSVFDVVMSFVLRDLLMIWTGMVIYRLIHEFLRLRDKAGENENLRVYLNGEFWGIMHRDGDMLVWKVQIAPEPF